MMSADLLKTGTWCWKSNVASWDFQLAGRGDGDLQGDYRRLLLELLRLLGDFAAPREIGLTTGSGGENAAVIAVDALPDGAEGLERVLRAHTDLEDVVVRVDLLCTPPDGEGTVRLLGGATLWLTLEEDEEDAPFRLLVELQVDLYAPLSWGEVRDNRALAALNRPRLAGFLRRLQEELGAELVDIDAPSYRGQVGPFGFDPGG